MNLEELRLAANNLSYLERFSAKKLRFLDLSCNNLHSEDLKTLALCDLPCLEHLEVSQNRIEAIEPLNLVFLGIADNIVSDWREFNKLSQMPQLRKLRAQRNLLISHDIRLEMIARVPQITVFNSSEISPEERVSSERYFLQIIYKKHCIKDTADIPPSILEEYPTIPDLVNKHGAPVISVQQKSVIAIKFEHAGQTKSATLSLSATVRQVRVAMSKHFKLRFGYLKDSRGQVFTRENFTLAQYDVSDGDVVTVSEEPF